jgi:CheY-like chemotaxis protein
MFRLETGNTVEVAHTGPTGIETARQFGPEVVLCNIGLPGLDGYAVTRSLRQETGVRGAYLIAVTGYAQEPDQRLAKEAGFDMHLRKPIDFDDLQQILAKLSLERPAGNNGIHV